MLYVTTRNHRDSYTAQRALKERRGPDGGLFLPFRVNPFSGEEIAAMGELSFNQCLAKILNLLFHTRLQGSELDYSIGRRPVRLASMNHRVFVGECWHSSGQEYMQMVRKLSGIVCPGGGASVQPGAWLEIGVRIGVLFGIYGELLHSGAISPGTAVDISVVSGDFSAPMSAWYARAWGLPVGKIICCCNENSAVWDLVHQGQLRTDGISVRTAVPKADVSVPEGLERLISAACGEAEALRYVDACRSGRIYAPQEAALQRLRNGITVSVVSSERILSTIPAVYAASSYLLSPCAALSYAGLQDYRSGTGETRCALVLGEHNPHRNADGVSALGTNQ